MLCYRCGSHVSDGSESCTTCGQKFAAGMRGTPTGTFSRRKLAQVEGAPYKVGDVVSERYEIKDVVGQGPVGVVYRALDREVDVEVALKVVSPRLLQTPDDRKTFSREIRTAKKLAHANIVKLYDEGLDEDRTYFTAQFLDGLTLRRIIDLRKEKGQFFSLREIEPIISQIAAALEHAAEQTRPHGDMKPDNVIVLPDLLKVTDFGLATGLPRQPFIAAQRGRGADRYLAPEFLTDREIDARADIFSLGAILGEMVAGVLPEGNAPPLAEKNPQVPHALEQLYRRACNSNPSARYAKASELAADLAAIVEKAGDAAASTPARPAPPPPPSAATRAPPRGKTPPPLESVDPDDIEEEKPRAVAAAVATELEADAASRTRPKPPPPPPQDDPPPERRSGSGPRDAIRQSGVRDAQQKPGNGKTPSGVKDAVRQSGVREAQRPKDPSRQSGVKPAALPPPPPSESKTGEVRLEKPVEKPPSRRKQGAGPSPALLVLAVVLGLGVAVGGFLGWRAWTDSQAQIQELAAKADKEQKERERLEQERGAREAKEREERERALAAAAVAADAGTPAPPEVDAGVAPPPVGVGVGVVVGKKPELAPKTPDDKIDQAIALATNPAKLEEERKRLEEERRKAAAAAAPPTPDDEAKKREAALEEARRKAEEERNKPTGEKVAAVTGGGGTTCPAGMSFVAPGAFQRGVAGSDPMKNFGDLPLEKVEVPGFCVDKWEFPNRPRGKPTTRTPYAAAESACRKSGKRLCSETEWEKACKGPGNAKFPYGAAFDAKACNTQDENGTDRPVADAGSSPRCRSGFGVYDLAGNVAEWTSSDGPGGKVTKGGAANRPDFDSRCGARKGKGAGTRDDFLGFRCCADPK